MKKTIQINIAGVVFTIEEDAFNKLDEYLSSVKNYFSAYEGSQEIISDIEARVAEKFYEKKKYDSSYVLTNDDVNALISSMGTVADFEAVAEEEDLATPERAASATPFAATSGTGGIPTERKRIYRDVKHKALAGVLAGVAHYFTIDVTWVRILFLLGFFVLSPTTDSGLSGLLLIAYVVAWAVFPPSHTLEEDPRLKKFYRNPDGKVVGGVASGLAAYFGIDVAIVRVIFVASVLFFGTGILAYIILWAVSPEASTLTQKMEMKGEPLTLENIESNVKRNLNVTPNAPETTLTRLVLFPFRLLSALLRGLGNLIKGLGPVMRVLAGILLLVLGLAFLLAVVMGVGAFFGLFANNHWVEGSHFFNIFAKDINPWAGFFAFLAFGLPAVAVSALGLSLLTNKRLGNRTHWITGLAVWLFGVMGAATMGANYSMNFARKATHETTQDFQLPANMLVLDAAEDNDGNQIRGGLNVELEGTSSNRLYLENRFRAAGSTRQVALDNAQSIRYQVQQQDSAIVFATRLLLDETKGFREQSVNATLYIPYNKPFKITEAFANELLSIRELKNYDLSRRQVSKFTFMMKPDEGITCLDCPQLSEEEAEAFDRNSEEDFYSQGFDGDSFEKGKQYSKPFKVDNFKAVEVGGTIHVFIKQGNEFVVEAEANRQKDLDDLEVKVIGNTLEIGHRDIFLSNREEITVFITMPTLSSVDVSGAASLKAIGFKQLDNLSVELSGASRAALGVEVNRLDASLRGASSLDIRGKANQADFDVSGASTTYAQKMAIQKAFVEASGASTVKLGKVPNLGSKTTGASSVERD